MALNSWEEGVDGKVGEEGGRGWGGGEKRETGAAGKGGSGSLVSTWRFRSWEEGVESKVKGEGWGRAWGGCGVVELAWVVKGWGVSCGFRGK